MCTSRQSHAFLPDGQDPVLNRRKEGRCRIIVVSAVGEWNIRQVDLTRAASASGCVCVAVSECEVEGKRKAKHMLVTNVCLLTFL